MRGHGVTQADDIGAGLYLGAGEGVLDYDPYMAANIAGYDEESRRLNPVNWATTAYQGMRPEREGDE